MTLKEALKIVMDMAEDHYGEYWNNKSQNKEEKTRKEALEIVKHFFSVTFIYGR